MDFTWTYTIDSPDPWAVLRFSGTAGNGIDTFVEVSSNTAQVSSTGAAQTVIWELGSNTAGVPVVSNGDQTDQPGS